MADALLGVAASVALVASLAVLSRLVATVFTHVDLPLSTLTQLTGATKLLLAGSAFGGATLLVHAFDPGTGLVQFLARPDGFAALLNVLWISTVTAGGLVAIGWGIRRFVERLRTGDYTPPAPIRRRARLVAGSLLVLLAGLVTVLQPRPLFVFVLAVATWTIGYRTLAQSATVTLFGAPRDPTEAERDRIEAAYEQFGRTPGHVSVYPEPGNVGILVAGRGIRRRLLVAKPVLDRVDDAQLAVALAQADERARRDGIRAEHLQVGLRLTTIALILTVLALVLPSMVTGTTLPVAEARILFRGLLLALGCVVLQTLFAIRSRRAVYEADRFTADRFGVEQVLAVYERFHDDLSPVRPDGPTNYAARWLNTVPSLVQRSDRLVGTGPETETRSAREGRLE